MQLISNKGISNDKYVTSIVEQLVQYPELIVQVSRMFTDYNTVPPDLEEINEHVADLLHSPKIKTPTDITKKLATTIRSIYMLNPEHFNSIKAKVLENLIYIFGPFTTGLKRRQVFIEPTIKDGGHIVGESNMKCDFVFYEKNEKPLEFVECKSNIYSVIPKTLPFERAQAQIKKKITYLHHAYVYLEEAYCRPFIYFACYNSHIESEKRNLQENWGYPHISISNLETLLEIHLERKRYS